MGVFEMVRYSIIDPFAVRAGSKSTGYGKQSIWMCDLEKVPVTALYHIAVRHSLYTHIITHNSDTANSISPLLDTTLASFFTIFTTYFPVSL